MKLRRNRSSDRCSRARLRVLAIVAMVGFVGSCGGGDPVQPPQSTKPPPPPLPPSQTRSAFVRAQGRRLVVGPDDTDVRLKGINLDTYFGEVPQEDPNTVFFKDITSTQFQNIVNMGFNAVRLPLNYLLFERDDRPMEYRQEGWDYLDAVIGLARQFGLFVVLDCHVPQGGLQSSGGLGAELWDDPSNQTRYRALWKAIATRYRDEPVVAAYDLLNEPTPTQSRSQYLALMVPTIADIRSVDSNHLIILEQVNWIMDRNGNAPGVDSTIFPETQHIRVDDPNVMYDIHFYFPVPYTQQSAEGNPPEGVYPDPSVTETTWDHRTFPRGKAYLAAQLAFFTDFMDAENVPMSVGEWQPNRGVHNDPSKGGLTYMGDLMDLYNQSGLHYFLYNYWMLYQDNNFNPAPAGFFPEVIAKMRELTR